MSNFIGEKVSIIGQVLSVSNPMAISTTDDQKVNVLLKNTVEYDFPPNQWVEVVGIVKNPNTIEEEVTIPMKGEADKKSWNSLVDILAKNRDIF